MTYLVINKQHAQFVTQGALASVGVYNELDGVVKNSIRLKVHPLIRPATSILSMSIGSMVTVRLVGGPRQSTL